MTVSPDPARQGFVAPGSGLGRGRLHVETTRWDDLRVEIGHVEAAGVVPIRSDPRAVPTGELMLTSCSPAEPHEALELVRGRGSVAVAVADLDGKLCAQFIAAGATAVWNRLADPRDLPRLIRWLSRSAGGPSLTVDEMQLLTLLATNTTIREIAEKVFVSERAFYRRLKGLYAKLGARHRADAVCYYETSRPQ